MNIIMRYENGRRIEGVLLSMDENHFRVVVRRLNETLEFEQVEGVWMGGNGTLVEIESIIFPSSEVGVPRTMHA